ncbi:DUF3572 family protein [Alteraurantiacibacter aquimixticola]|uniref:DUF3572 family protein n=1 Tax=Alteraurantiacibacter aquimixticola TaxID=2489173 RepID=UPI001FE3A92C|nr:DUF3572 family protein [Alteraurantiacibacter aquimixticola]
MKHASVVALGALGWILAEERRAHRFLDLTGLTVDGLRTAVDDVATHRAVFEFLCAHEPDLVEAARALDMEPAELARMKEALSQ